MTHQSEQIVTLKAGQDFGGLGPVLLSFSDTNGIEGVVLTADLTKQPIGVLAETPPILPIDQSGFSVGKGVSVALLNGIIPMIAGGAITSGNFIRAADPQEADSGHVIGMDDYKSMVGFCVGVALDSAVAGETFRVLAQLSYQKPLNFT